MSLPSYTSEFLPYILFIYLTSLIHLYKSWTFYIFEYLPIDNTLCHSESERLSPCFASSPWICVGQPEESGLYPAGKARAEFIHVRCLISVFALKVLLSLDYGPHRPISSITSE